MKKIGLFFGSFNPIHIGHLAIANYVVEYNDIEQLWFVISPHNPHKHKTELASEYHRKEMAKIAINNDNRFKVSNIEFELPQPSYTVDTLTYLKQKFPNHIFTVIMGEDNLATLHSWRDYDKIISNHSIICYPRVEKQEYTPLKNANIKIVEAPILNISATQIRDSIAKNKKLNFFVPNGVYDYIIKNELYI